jgi:hypothetical protein
VASSKEWTELTDSELLKLRICDLGLRIEGTELESSVERLREELRAKGLQFQPRVYLGDEWFSPEGMNAIAVPFYLAHPRLKQLERSMMMEVEGGTSEWFMRLIRHEAGHCFDHNYRFSRRTKWAEIFGSPEEDYHPETYRPRPYSRSFVKNLENWYAQAHPDEDFAETFAVWLNPDRDWRHEYAEWPVALEKLLYVEELARASRRIKTKAEPGTLPFNAAKMKSTLEKYYLKRKKEHADEYPDFYDSDLRRIFNGVSELSRRDYGAGRFMRRNRKAVVDSVTHWSAERKFTVDQLVRKLIDRCDELDLRMGKSESDTSLELASYLATLVTHYLFTGRFKRSV